MARNCGIKTWDMTSSGESSKTTGNGEHRGQSEMRRLVYQKRDERAAKKNQEKIRTEESIWDERYWEGHKSLIWIFNKRFLLCCETYCNLSKFNLIQYFSLKQNCWNIQPQKVRWIYFWSGFLSSIYTYTNWKIFFHVLRRYWLTLIILKIC